MNILNDDNSIRFGCFKCLNTAKVYTITSSTSTFDLSKPSYLDKAILSEETIKREDGVVRKLSRSHLKERFTNIEEYKQKLNR